VVSVTEQVHATAISAGGRAVLIRGPSASGKSDLALRCLALAPSALLPHAAELVADDQVELRLVHGRPVARAPTPIAGLIEVRGLGILSVPFRAEAEVVLVADLVAPGQVERYPDPSPVTRLLGADLAHVRIAPFEASAPVRLLLALARTGHRA